MANPIIWWIATFSASGNRSVVNTIGIITPAVRNTSIIIYDPVRTESIHEMTNAELVTPANREIKIPSVEIAKVAALSKNTMARPIKMHIAILISEMVIESDGVLINPLVFLPQYPLVAPHIRANPKNKYPI